MYWIAYRNNEPIPEELKYPDWKTDKDDYGNTPLMLWIQYRNNEQLPEELKYSGWKTDKDKYNETPLIQ
jgi:hypothetical protein